MNYNNRTVEINDNDVKVEFKKDLVNGIFRVYCVTNIKTGKKYYGLTMLDLTPLKGMPFVDQRTVFELMKATFGDRSTYKGDVGDYGDKKFKVEEICAVVGLAAGKQAEKDAIANAKANGEDLYNTSNGGEYGAPLTRESLDSIAICLYDAHNKTTEEIANELELSEGSLDQLSSDPARHFGYDVYNDGNGHFITAIDNNGKVRKLYLPLRERGKQEVIDKVLAFGVASAPKKLARICEKYHVDFSSVFTAAVNANNGNFIIPTERITKKKSVKVKKAITSNKYTNTQLCKMFNMTPQQLSYQKQALKKSK